MSFSKEELDRIAEPLVKDLMDKWLIPPIVAENEQLKARVIALEAALGEATGRIETDGKLIADLARLSDRTDPLPGKPEAFNPYARLAELEAKRDVNARPTSSNADEWRLFLAEHKDALDYVAVQIVEAIEAKLLAERETCAMYVEALAQRQGGNAVVYRQCAAVIRARSAP